MEYDPSSDSNWLNAMIPTLEITTIDEQLRPSRYNGFPKVVQRTFIKLADHLWKRHCQREFKTEQHQDEESWREMYFRLFGQREQNLKTLTKSIVLSQSEKPKGCQIKMAYVQGVAKPPRELRGHPESCSPSTIPFNRLSKRKLANEERNDSGSGSVAAANTSFSGGSQQDAKRVKKIAPVMAKSLKTFKNHIGPWQSRF
uniref:Elongin-A-like n=1 Tax=Phascolarctos cinereus TaxID=38626 RepID=A0A6P5KV00_PHACI|nr:elongin-A-like [Phascolarctos cinereus]